MAGDQYEDHSQILQSRDFEARVQYGTVPAPPESHSLLNPSFIATDNFFSDDVLNTSMDPFVDAPWSSVMNDHELAHEDIRGDPDVNVWQSCQTPFANPTAEDPRNNVNKYFDITPTIVSPNNFNHSTYPGPKGLSNDNTNATSQVLLQRKPYRTGNRHRVTDTANRMITDSGSDGFNPPRHLEVPVRREVRLSRAASGACKHWFESFQGMLPSHDQMHALHVAYCAPLDLIKQWFHRHRGMEDRTAGQGRVSSTVPDATLDYRHNRRKCIRKLSRGNGLAQSIVRDEKSPYVCTSRCGKKFKAKDSWRKHEEINFHQELWLCSIGPCSSKPIKARVRLRKDHFRSHLSKHHDCKNVLDAELRKYHIHVDSIFDRHCIFQDCEEHFNNWRERIDHIAKEFESPWDMSQWKSTDQGISNVENGNDGDAHPNSIENDDSANGGGSDSHPSDIEDYDNGPVAGTMGGPGAVTFTLRSFFNQELSGPGQSGAAYGTVLGRNRETDEGPYRSTDHAQLQSTSLLKSRRRSRSGFKRQTMQRSEAGVDIMGRILKRLKITDTNADLNNK